MSNPNLYALFESRFPEDRSVTLVETPAGERFSYGDMEQFTARLSAYLTGLGVKRGDRVAVQVDKSPQALFQSVSSNISSATRDRRRWCAGPRPRIACAAWPPAAA